MFRSMLLLVMLAAVSVAVAAPTVVVNGNPAPVTVMDVNGKAFVDIVALMQILGGKATYDAAAGKLYINSTAPTTAPPKAANWGTPQLPGENGELGVVYKLRQGSPIYFRLNSAEYSVEQLHVGKALLVPQAAEKLLVLHFSIQNPQQTEVTFRFDSLRFTAVDAMNVNHEARGMVGDEQTKGDLSIHLKPAQRIEGYVGIVVPAQGVVPKLIVMPPTENDGPVLRYDLRDKVAPLPAPIADPADPTGATALQTVPARIGDTYALRNFDLTVEKCEVATTALEAGVPLGGGGFFVATIVCKNDTANDLPLRFDTFVSTLADGDGLQLKLGRNLLAATSSTAFNQRVTAGTEARVRVYFTIPQDIKPKTLSLREATSRTYQFDVTP